MALLASRAEIELARRDLGTFGEYVFGYKCLPHIRQWVDVLTDERAQQVLLITPPGHGKTTWVGIIYPLFCIGHNPGQHVIYLSNTATQAEKASVACRDTTRSNVKYRTVFPGIEPDLVKGWAQEKWFVRRGDTADKDPTMLAAGAFGPILGARTDLLILDDVMDEEIAASAEQRKKLKEWIRNTAFTRRVRGCKTVCILTRWSEDDLGAEFIKDPAWAVIHMPALGFWGVDTPLAPEIATLEELLAIKNDPKGGRLRFENIWQGNPTLQQGTILQRAWWRRMPMATMPRKEDCQVLIHSWDTGFKKTADSAFSVCLTMGLYKGNVFIFSMYRKKVEFPELLKVSRQLYKIDRPRLVIVEDKASGQCYSDDTEILTRAGWKPLKDIEVGVDELATRNTSTKQLEWQKASLLTSEHYQGDMYALRSRFLDILVTPEHRILLARTPRALNGRPYYGGESLVKADTVAEQYTGSMCMPTQSVWLGQEIGERVFCDTAAARTARIGRNVGAGKSIRMSGMQYCAFMGLYLAEGSSVIQSASKGGRGTIYISQMPNSKWFGAMKEMLDSIFGVVYHDGTSFVLHGRGLAEYLQAFGKRASEKFIPSDIMDATPEQLGVFWKFYRMGDGHITGISESICTSSRKMADQLQEVAQKMGYWASISPYALQQGSRRLPDGRVFDTSKCKPTYRVGLRHGHSARFHIHRRPYDGMVYCPTVPNGTVYVRRNGHPFWSGNSLIQSLTSGAGMEEGDEKVLPVYPIKADSDQVSYVRSFSGYVEAGRVWLPEEEYWQEDFLAETSSYPNGRYTDIVMALAHGLSYLTAGDQFEPLSAGSIIGHQPVTGEAVLGDWADLPGSDTMHDFLGGLDKA